MDECKENMIQEKKDKHGNIWRKVYIGGGPNFQDTWSQCQELAEEMGTEIEKEEIDPAGFPCFEGKGEKMYRILIKEKEK